MSCHLIADSSRENILTNDYILRLCRKAIIFQDAINFCYRFQYHKSLVIIGCLYIFSNILSLVFILNSNNLYRFKTWYQSLEKCLHICQFHLLNAHLARKASFVRSSPFILSRSTMANSSYMIACWIRH